jgi:hypothetical protein
LFFLTVSSISYSQDFKRKFFLEGSINPFNYSFESKNRFRMEADARGGIFLSDKVSIGLMAGTRMWRYKEEYLVQSAKVIYLPSNVKIKGEFEIYSIGPFFRQYFRYRRMVIFTEEGGGYSFFNWIYDGPSTLKGYYHKLFLHGGVGAYCFIKSNLAFQAMVSYKWDNLPFTPLNYYYSKNRITCNIGFTVFMP